MKKFLLKIADIAAVIIAAGLSLLIVFILGRIIELIFNWPL